MFRRFAVTQGGAWRLPSLRSALGYEVAAPFGATSPYLRTSLALSRVGLIKSHLWKCQNGRWRVAHIDGDVRLVDGHEPPSYISTECSVDLRTDNPNGRKASGGNAFTGSRAKAKLGRSLALPHEASHQALFWRIADFPESRTRSMNILVCLKQILDPEMPSRDFRIDAAGRDADRQAAGLVMNIFCANALETALQFREKYGGKITVITIGAPSAEEILRKALALRVDSAVLVKNDYSQRLNPWCVARVLAAATRKLGDFDLVLTGRESGDWGDGQTGGLLAEELGRPCVSMVDEMKFDASKPGLVQLKRQTDQGWEAIEAKTPTVFTVTNNEHNVPRIAKTRDVMQAFRQPITTWSLAELGVDTQWIADDLASTEVVELTIPKKQTHCEFVTGDSLEERISKLAQRIVSIVQSA